MGSLKDNGFLCSKYVYSNIIPSLGFYVNFNWQTNNLDVNPKSIVIYDFKWVSNSGDADKGG